MNKHSGVDDGDGSRIITDRLTQLPQHVLYHIISLLPQEDAVRTSVLSKSWRYLWYGRLNIEFLDNWFARKRDFWPFLDRTLQRYLHQNLSLHKFFVYIVYDVDLLLLQKWIPIVIMNMGVRSFNLILSWSTKVCYPLPLVVFQSESLVELHLQQCNLSTLKSTDNVMLNNLQTLRLRDVYITDEIFQKILSGCPLIENLDLLECIGLKSIKLHKHHNIKDFGCSVIVPLIIEIEDPHTLESFDIENSCGYWLLPHKNMQFPHLKSLKLHRVQLPAETFNNFSSFFHCLNELTLTKCDGLKEFILSSTSIKRLTIKMDTGNRIKACIDTPNILYFEYHGFLPSIKFTTTSNEWESKILLWYKLWYKLILTPSEKDTTSWFLKLNKLLKALSQSLITLDFIHIGYLEYEKLHISDSYGSFDKPVAVEHLKLKSSSEPSILNCFFRIFRPRYVHMDLYDGGMYRDEPKLNNLAVFMSMLIPNEIGCYFWLKDLEEVDIEVRDEEAKEWHCVKGTSLLALPFQQHIRFRLTWREQLIKFT